MWVIPSGRSSLSSKTPLPLGPAFLRHLLSPEVSPLQHVTTAEGSLLVFLSLEQGLSLHGLNSSFAAEFLSPNDLMGSSCWFSEGLRVTLRTAAQDSLQRVLDSKEDF